MPCRVQTGLLVNLALGWDFSLKAPAFGRGDGLPSRLFSIGAFLGDISYGIWPLCDATSWIGVIAKRQQRFAKRHRCDQSGSLNAAVRVAYDEMHTL